MTTTQDPTKLPALPNVPADASPELRRYLEALGEILNIRTGRAGDPRDRAVTLRELLDSGLAVDLASAGVANFIPTVSFGFSSVYNLRPEPLGFLPVPTLGSFFLFAITF